MSSREEFEAWLSREYPWGNEALDKAFFSGNDDNGYYTGGDFIYDGSSCADALFWAWRGWQESHKQTEAKCAALAAELKQSQIDAGCYKKGMEASNERLVQVAAENAALKEWSPNPHSTSMFEAIEKAEALMDDGMPELAMVEAFEILKMKRTPATDSFLAEVRAQGIEMAAKSDQFSMWVQQGLRSFAIGVRQGGAE